LRRRNARTISIATGTREDAFRVHHPATDLIRVRCYTRCGMAFRFWSPHVHLEVTKLSKAGLIRFKPGSLPPAMAGKSFGPSLVLAAVGIAEVFSHATGTAEAGWRPQWTPSFLAAILVPATRFAIFWNAISRA
jgi:hypothetical protein